MTGVQTCALPIYALKIQIRQELTDDLGDEARLAFEYAIRMMKDLYDGE